MKTKICEMLDIEVPIFAFSHCRDVVVEVSKAGGFGVLGVTYISPDQLEAELKWIDEHIEGKPYGVDVVMPNNYQKLPNKAIGPADLPQAQVEFIGKFLDDAGVPPLPEDDNNKLLRDDLAKVQMTREQVMELIDIALTHPIKAVVNALGTPPKEMVDRLHKRGIKVGSLVGKVEHAYSQKEAGVDFVVAQGCEAGGHTGKISSMILWPQVIDAISPIPVLAAGGISGGRQMAAAMSMGANGVWCGSIWLGTRESELLPEMKERFYEASSDDAVQSRVRSGKPARLLRSPMTEAWEQADSPGFLPMPYQTLVMRGPQMRVERARHKEFMYYPVGQVVGNMNEETSCKQVVYDMMSEFIESTEHLYQLLPND